MKYQYENHLCKLLDLKVRKFKNGASQPKEEVYVSLEKLEGQPSTLYLFVRSNSTKVVIYQGILMKNISRLEHFLDKEDNLKFQVIRRGQSSTGDVQNNKMEREVVKIQFESIEECQNFKKTVSDYFEPTNWCLYDSVFTNHQ